MKYQPDLDTEGKVACIYPTEEWARANIPGRVIRPVRDDAVITLRELFPEDACILCGRLIRVNAAKLQHFRKHVRDGSLYEHNRPRAAGPSPERASK